MRECPGGRRAGTGAFHRSNTGALYGSCTDRCRSDRVAEGRSGRGNGGAEAGGEAGAAGRRRRDPVPEHGSEGTGRWTVHTFVHTFPGGQEAPRARVVMPSRYAPPARAPGLNTPPARGRWTSVPVRSVRRGNGAGDRDGGGAGDHEDRAGTGGAGAARACRARCGSGTAGLARGAVPQRHHRRRRRRQAYPGARASARPRPSSASWWRPSGRRGLGAFGHRPAEARPAGSRRPRGPPAPSSTRPKPPPFAPSRPGKLFPDRPFTTPAPRVHHAVYALT